MIQALKLANTPRRGFEPRSPFGRQFSNDIRESAYNNLLQYHYATLAQDL